MLPGFINQNLLQRALTHSSYTKDSPQNLSNERLEFLGDAVLKLVFSEYLFEKFPEHDEGLLTKYRARLISDEILSLIGFEIGLEKLIKVGLTLNSKNLPKSVVGNCVEALIGALYLDQGMIQAREFILEHWNPKLIEKCICESMEIDYKSLLQEKIQGQYKEAPYYVDLRSFGPDHDKSFEVAAMVREKQLATGSGKTKKLASQEAAKNSLKYLENLGEDLF